MQRFFHVRTLIVLFIGATLFTSCGVDENPIPPVGGTPPSVSLLTESGFISTDEVLAAGTTLNFKVDASKGENQMNTFVVQRDGSDIDQSEITINGAAAAGNPRLLFDADKDAFTYDVSITPHDAGDALYTFIVTGDGDNTEDAVSVTITIEAGMPELTIDGPGTITVMGGSLAGFKLNGVTNGPDFTTLGFFQDGVILPADRVRCNGVAPSTNPFDVEAADVAGFTMKDFAIQPTNIIGVQNYSAHVLNVNGDSATVNFTIELMASGTPVDATFTGVLLENAAGNDPTGGINLYDGETVSVNADNAHVIDLGNNTAGTAWLEQIGGDNGGTLRAISAAQIDAGFTLAGLSFKEEVQSAYDEAVVLNNNESDVVEVGDYFFANVDNDYFALEVKEKGVNTAGLGFYRFDIVKAEF